MDKMNRSLLVSGVLKEPCCSEGDKPEVRRFSVLTKLLHY